MFCHKCGTEVSDAARFCHKCGAELTHEGTSLQTEGSSHTKIKVGNNDMGEELPSTTAVPNLGNEPATYFPLPDGQTVNSVEFTPNQGNETTAGVDSHIQKGPVSAIPIHQSYAASADTPKKSKTMPIVIGIGFLIVLAVVLLSFLALSDNHDDMTELTQIFTSDSEGISFQYPRGWKDVAILTND